MFSTLLSTFKIGRGGGSEREDYERLLTDLDQQIRGLEVRLMEGRLAERSLSLRLISTGVVGYVGVLFYVFILTPLPTPLHLILVISFPFVFYYLRVFWAWVYGRRIGGMEEELQALRGKQKLKLEELKQKSDYYRTIKLIERFDSNQKNNNNNQKATPKKETTTAPPSNITNTTPTTTTLTNTNVAATRRASREGMVLPRGWLDRWTDYLLGEEETSIRYALICGKCHAHNGLSLLPIVTFSCRNCHYLNNDSSNNNNINNIGGEKAKKNPVLGNILAEDVDATPIAEHPHLKKRK